MNPSLINNAKLNPCYSHMDASRFERKHDIIPVSTYKGDDVEKVIFAPDPITGIPRSDLGLLLNNQTRPEVAAYIRERLTSPSSTGTKFDDADSALEMSRGYGESLQQYASRLRELCHPKKDEK